MIAQCLVQLRYIDPNNLLAEERDELFDACFESLHALALLCHNAASLQAS
jgi:hypothetical protein